MATTDEVDPYHAKVLLFEVAHDAVDDILQRVDGITPGVDTLVAAMDGYLLGLVHGVSVTHVTPGGGGELLKIIDQYNADPMNLPIDRELALRAIGRLRALVEFARAVA